MVGTVVVGVCLLVAGRTPGVQAQTTPTFSQGEATVRVSFRVSSSPIMRAAAWVAEGGTSPEATAGASNSVAVTPNLPNLDIRTIEVRSDAVDATILALQSRLDVAWAERVSVVRKHGDAPSAPPGPPIAAPRARTSAFTGHTPNDPSFGDQWGLRYVGADLAWSTARALNVGTSIKVAIVDSGVQYDHPDLISRMAPTDAWGRCETGACVSYVAGNSATHPRDGDGHGTHVSGIVAASTDNAVGVAGTAGDRPIVIVPIKVLDDNGNGTTDGVAAGIAWAVSHGAKIINMSLGGDTDTQTVNSAIDAAANAGVLITISAGNCGATVFYQTVCRYQNEPDYPAAYAGTSAGLGKLIPVASIGRSGSVSNFSTQASYVSSGIAAPGEEIYSSYKLSGYQAQSGTSMASPHVAGAAAVLWSTFPTLTRTRVRDAILGSATTNTTTIASPNAYGNGLLNIDAALYAVQPGIAPSATATHTPTATPTATSTPTNTPTSTPSPTATATPSPTATATPQPTNVVADVHHARVASIRDAGFVVTWRSTSAVVGTVRWGPSGSPPTSIAHDDRGPSTVSTLHFITVQGLAPSQSYDIDIISGGVMWPADGTHVTVTTGPTLALASPDIAYGTVQSTAGVSASEALILFEAQTGSERSLPDARLVGTSDGGKWTLDLTGFRSRVSLSEFPIDPTTTLATTAYLPDGTFSISSIPINTARSGSSTVTKASTVTQGVILSPGWNLVGLPLQPSTPITASTVCTAIDASGGLGAAVEIIRWANGGWDPHPCAIAGNDFALASPDGFAIRVTRTATWSVTGTPFDGPLLSTMPAGWSLVGVRSPVAPITSTSLFTAISSRYPGEARITEIARWNAGQWEPALLGIPTNRFDVGSGRAYFVRLPAPFTWQIP